MDRSLATLAPSRPRARRGFLPRLLGLFELGRSRRRLAEFDDRMLRDLGLTREEARREARRLDWDVPSHWLR